MCFKQNGFDVKNWAALTNYLVTFVKGQEGQMASQKAL